MRRAFGKVGVTLHNQYVLGYYPPENAPAGKYRQIKVQLVVPTGLPKLNVYSRTDTSCRNDSRPYFESLLDCIVVLGTSESIRFHSDGPV